MNDLIFAWLALAFAIAGSIVSIATLAYVMRQEREGK